MSTTLQVLGEVKLIGASTSASTKLNNGLTKLTDYDPNVVELDPGETQTLEFESAKDYLYFDCNKKLSFSLNDSTDKFTFHRLFMLFGSNVSSVTFYNDVGSDPVKTIVRVVAANGEIF